MAQAVLIGAQESLEVARILNHLALEGLEADQAQDLKRLERLRPTGLLAWLIWLLVWFTGCLLGTNQGDMESRGDSARLQWRASESILVAAVSAAQNKCILVCLEDGKQAMQDRQELEHVEANTVKAARASSAIAAAACSKADRKTTAREAEGVRTIRYIFQQERIRIPGAESGKRTDF